MSSSPAICKTASEFINHVKKLVCHGARFSPFLGSGISAQSGILMGQEFPDYIAYTVYRVLGGGGAEPEYWDIRQRGWPPYPTSQEIDATYAFILQEYRSLIQPCEVITDHGPRKKITEIKAAAEPARTGDVELNRILVPSILRTGKLYDLESHLDAKRRHLRIQDTPNDPNLPPSSTRYIHEAALRSLSHWTRTLEFLSKVAVADGPAPRLYLDDEPDIAVIDSFNAYITRGKKPNLIHNMISRLSRSLRSQVILTTNFDTLIEESYRAQGEPLHSLAVSIKGGLPSFATVRAQDCLIKLHGDILETRADSTINDPPSDRDKKLFFQYLRGPREPQHQQPDDFVQSHLLVLGYSASDARCVQMIKYVLDLAPDFRVFWVSHSDRDTQNIQDIFGAYMGDAAGRPPQLHLYQTDRTDLLLWELYQQINLSLPGGGYSVQFNHFVPPLPYDGTTDLDQGKVKHIRDWLIQHTTLDKARPPGHNIACIDSPSGTARPLQAGFYALQKERYEAAWIELEDHRGEDDFFFQVLSIIAQRIGQFQLEWTSFMPVPVAESSSATATTTTATTTTDARPATIARSHRIRLLVEKFKIDPTKWFFFLYGRNGPGGCSGWSKNLQHLYWNEATHRRFEALLIDLASMGFRIVYMPHGPKRAEHNMEKIEEIATVAGSHFGWPKSKPKYVSEITELLDVKNSLENTHLRTDTTTPLLTSRFAGSPRPFSTMLDAVCAHFLPYRLPPGENPNAPAPGGTRAARCLWLYGLTLFRQSRHPSSLISDAVLPCPRKFIQGDWSLDPDDADWNHSQAINLKDNDLLRNWLVFTNGKAEAATATPASINIDGTDIEGWLNVLSRSGVLMCKPGGYAWKYRDARLGIQYLLEQVTDFKFDAELLGDQPTLLTIPSLRHLRPRIHYFIGSWYLNAFYSTGHYMPLIEAIYQTVQCLEFIDDYQRAHKDETLPDPNDTRTSEERQRDEDEDEDEEKKKKKKEEKEEKLNLDRLNLAWLALCQLRRLILVGRKSLLFWCPGIDIAKAFFTAGNDPKYTPPEKPASDVEPSFEGMIRSWQEYLGGLPIPDTTTLLGSFTQHCAILIEEIHHLRVAVLCEGFAHGGRSSPLVPYTFIQASRTTRRMPDHGITNVDNDEWYNESIHLLCGTAASPGIPGFIRPQDLQDQDDDQRAILTDLFTGPDQASTTSKSNPSKIAYLKNLWLAGWAASPKKDADAYQGAWIISEFMYRAVRRAKLQHHAPEAHQTPDDVSRIWRAVCALGNLGIHLCNHLSADLHLADCDLRVRILTVYAVALTYLERFAEASRRFNEAHALIISGMDTTSGRELARIHVRRSEMYLWKARVLLTKHTRWSPTAIKDLGDDEIEELIRSAVSSPELKKLKPDVRKARLADIFLSPQELRALTSKQLATRFAGIPKPLTIRELKKIIVCVDDAWAALERGDLGLGGVSHSTYWWYRLVALKLSCYAVLGDIQKNLPRSRPEITLWKSSLESCLPFRRRLHLPSVLVSLLRDGLIIGAGDHFRQLRLLAYVLEADQLLPPKERVFGQALPPDTAAPPLPAPLPPGLEPGYLTRHEDHYHQLLADIWRVIFPAEHPIRPPSQGRVAAYSESICKELEKHPHFYRAAYAAHQKTIASWQKNQPQPAPSPASLTGTAT